MSLFARWFGRKAEAAEDTAPPPADPRVDPRADLADYIRRQVAAGFSDEGVILTDATQVFDGEIEPLVLRQEAQQSLRQALGEQAAAQATWPDRTDCDRLDAAFAALEQDGIVARHNFTCCGTCGSAEIGDEIGAAADAGIAVRGYTFYHSQDTDSAVDGHGLYLNYGAVEEGEPAAVEIAREIVAELESHGLGTDWNGSWEQRIGVTIDWKRRR